MAAIYDFSARALDGDEVPMQRFRGKALLIVNTASQCGFTPQYAGLEALYRRFGPERFAVLGFPCNQFGHQEPAGEAEIGSFCSTKYDVTFPMFAKVEVNGDHAHPLWAFLKAEKSGFLGGAIKWNFTKFLIGPDGAVVGRFPPTTTPDSLAPRIEEVLPPA
jgi:glutathione peroxidase